MGIISRQIGWSQESNLLWQILKQLSRLTSTLFSLKEAATPKYKVYTALLTQSGGDNFQTQSSGSVQKGVTYFVDGGVIDVTDFSNVGGQFQTPETGGYYFVATIDGVPNEYGGATADYNTGAPVVTVLENTIGNIWFTYADIGYYQLSSESLFTRLKSTSIMQTPIDSGDQTVPGLYTTYFGGENDFYISTFKVSDVSAVNDYLLNTFIEIRVYN
jgi:hypothetical protein